MNEIKKRKSDNPGGEAPTKKQKDEFKNKKWNSNSGKGNNNGTNGEDWKSNRKQNFGGSKVMANKKKPATGGVRSKEKKQHLTSIVTEAKANYQLYTDKKIEKNEKQMLIKATYELVKDSIAELARMKGMGKVIASLLDRKNPKDIIHVLSFYDSPESKLLLMKGNGYRLAGKLIQTGNSKTINQFVDACLSNAKGLQSLMANFKSARVVNAAYTHGNTEAKKRLLNKLVLGNMPFSAEDGPLNILFTKCKADVVESCKVFLQSIPDGKSLQYEIIQDMLALCMQTHKETGMEIDGFIKQASENIVLLCNRATNSTLQMWTVWLANAQMRKLIMKGIKGKVVSLLQKYNGRLFLMALFESTDDTKALSKIVLKELLDPLDDLVQNIEARKLMEFLLLPRSTKFQHPKEIELLKEGDAVRTSKKSDETRFEEIREYMQESILSAFKKNCDQWLQDNKICLFIIAIIERYGDTFERDILQKLGQSIAAPSFSPRIAEKAARMILESLINADKVRFESNPEDSVYFLNEFIPILDKTEVSFLVQKCPSQVSHIFDTAELLKNALSFKFKKSWLCEKHVQTTISDWKSRPKIEHHQAGKKNPKIKKQR